MRFPTGLEVGNHYLYNPPFILYGDVANTTSMLRNIKGSGVVSSDYPPSSVASCRVSVNHALPKRRK